MSQQTNKRIRAASSSSNSPIKFVSSEQNEQRTPITQAWRDTPPSTQLYAQWTPEQQKTYCDELVKDRTRRLEAENEKLRERETWYKDMYEAEVRDRMYSNRTPIPEYVPSRIPVGAILHTNNVRLGSQGSTARASDKSSQTTLTQLSRTSSQ